ncbi:MAG: enoyl-CoA hydratase/isomerase family protein [Dehalococcoidales bacterium]|nr:enoyl-CoA hydratase/isomerase family protein [Dehalococcoidales bacterium]
MVIEYKKEGRIAIFTINRPEAMNSMNVAGLQEIGKAMTDFQNDPELWAGIFTAVGDRAFCAGADIKDALPYMKEHNGTVPLTHMNGLPIWKPLIAAINGIALGGGLEIALACDIRIAVEKARFGFPETTLGLIPGWGGTQRLPRLIPWAKAAEMIYSGKWIDANEAYRIGLINAIVTPDKLMTTAKEWAEVICKSGPLAVQAAKEAMIRGTSTSLENGLKIESEVEFRTMGTGDFIEGTGAFIEKRTPHFKAK